MNLKTKVAGYYKLQVIRPDGTVRESGEFPNLITNGGLDQMATSNSYLNFCQVGTGSTAPTVTDTALAARVAGSSTVNSSNVGTQSTAPYYAWVTRQWRFAAGTATGNISEVGVGWGPTGNLFSRALVLDSGGSPTTITVLADEVLDVTYELRYYAPTSDDSGSVTFTGNLAGTYDWIFRASNANSNNSGNGWYISASGTAMSTRSGTNLFNVLSGDIGTVTGSPAGSSSTMSYTTSSYSSGSYQLDFVATASTSQGNVTGGIRSAVLKMGVGYFQIQFDPAIPKTASDTLSITFRHSWGRV